MTRLRKNLGKQSNLQYPQKIPSNKLAKEMKDLYNENYKPLSKEIEEDIRR
jgi:hypothetical protein